MEYNFNQPLLSKINTSRDAYIGSCELISNSLGYASLILDEKNFILFASDNFYHFLKLKKNSLIGKNYIDELPGIFQKNNQDKIAEIHLQLINHNQRKIFLEVRKNGNIVDAYVTHKTPIFDSNNNFICLHIQYKPFTVARLANLGAKFHMLEGYYPLNRSGFSQISLSRIQQMIIYLYVRNYSYTEIADWITRFGQKISPTAVNKQLSKLKSIFNVTTSDALKDVSFKYGYDVAVPVEFLPEGSHDITYDVFDLWIC
jgi:hypothetical protein